MLNILKNKRLYFKVLFFFLFLCLLCTYMLKLHVLRLRYKNYCANALCAMRLPINSASIQKSQQFLAYVDYDLELQLMCKFLIKFSS